MSEGRRREAWVTGIGIVSCLGEGPDAHLQMLDSGKLGPDTHSFAPYVVHPLAPIDFDKQIPKRGDQRQMEPWQRIGTYAAGLALENAGLKGQTDVLSRMDMIVAAGGGERDLAVDGAILTGLRQAQDHDRYLNERLTSDLRPTLFLAQLSNLLAGNISIVHGVTGSSRTFMGEESAGIDSVRIALMRILAGQSQIALVGGAHNGERKEMLMLYEFGGFNLKDEFRPVFERSASPGFALGSLGCFLVLEERAHAEQRGASPLARLSAVVSDRSVRTPGAITTALHGLWSKLGPLGSDCAILSGASGAEPATGEERSFLQSHPEAPVRATGTFLGHGFEPQFPMNIALASLIVGRHRLFPPCDRSGIERASDAGIDQVVVTGVGHWRGEGLALVEAIDRGQPA